LQILKPFRIRLLRIPDQMPDLGSSPLSHKELNNSAQSIPAFFQNIQSDLSYFVRAELRDFDEKCEAFRHRYDKGMSDLSLEREVLYLRLESVIRKLEPVTSYLMPVETEELESGEEIEDQQTLQAIEELTNQDVFDELLGVQCATYDVEDRCDLILGRIKNIELELKEIGRYINEKTDDWHTSHVTILKQQRHIDNICHSNSIVR